MCIFIVTLLIYRVSTLFTCSVSRSADSSYDASRILLYICKVSTLGTGKILKSAETNVGRGLANHRADISAACQGSNGVGRIPEASLVFLAVCDSPAVETCHEFSAYDVTDIIVTPERARNASRSHPSPGIVKEV